MYHPYKQGYSVLPALEKLEEKPFDKDVFYEHYINEKRKALKTQKVFLYQDCDHRILYALEDFVKQNAPWVKGPYTLNNVAMQVQEDIAIHRIKDGCDWLAATHICFPSGWRPEEKIGRPLDEIHEPIPGMNLNNGYRLAEAASQRGPFRRFVWTPIYEYKINFHPDLPKKPFDRKNPLVYVKVEKQITWPVLELGAFFFILRQYIVEPDLRKLFKACNNMDEDQKIYKGVTQELIDVMGDIINGTIQSPHFIF
jgi:hypothetical protein